MKSHPVLMFFASFGIIFFLLIIAGIAGSLYFFGETPEIIRKDSIGVVEVEGIIHDARPTLKALKRYKDNDRIKAIIVRIDSPGGVVGPSQEIYQELKRIRGSKKVVASTGALAASGAYYVACGADQIVANPGTLTGSIGVIMEFVNLQKLYQWAKMETKVLKSGKYKDVGSPFRPMQQDEEKLLTDLIENISQQFKQVVLVERKLDQASLEEVSDGRVLSGEQALKLHLVDQLGNFEDAVQTAKKLAGLTGDVDLVYPPKEKPTLLRYLLGESVSGAVERMVQTQKNVSPLLYLMPAL
ncbi:MAG: signal peptide peptidase SppA, partial [Deltaproteobacteria bacterium]